MEKLVLQQITVTRHINDEGVQGFSVTTERDVSFIEVLGLLDAARWEIYRQMSERWSR